MKKFEIDYPEEYILMVESKKKKKTSSKSLA